MRMEQSKWRQIWNEEWSHHELVSLHSLIARQKQQVDSHVHLVPLTSLWETWWDPWDKSEKASPPFYTFWSPKSRRWHFLNRFKWSFFRRPFWFETRVPRCSSNWWEVGMYSIVNDLNFFQWKNLRGQWRSKQGQQWAERSELKRFAGECSFSHVSPGFASTDTYGETRKKRWFGPFKSSPHNE